MRSSVPPHSGASETGSTVLEVLVAILIISMLSVGMYAAVSAASRSSRRFQQVITASDSLLRLDDRLRDLASRIHTPYWMPSHTMKEEDGEIRVAYLDGDPEKQLVMRFSEGAIALSEGSAMYRYSGFDGARFSPALDKAGKAYGLVAEVQTGGGEPTRIVARFGGTPFQGPGSEASP